MTIFYTLSGGGGGGSWGWLFDRATSRKKTETTGDCETRT